VREWWILAVGLFLDADVGWFFSVASSGLSSDIEHSGHQMLGSFSRGLLDPEHGENVKVGQCTLNNKDYEGVNSPMDNSKGT
jgi:hypothetical protein